MGNTPFISFAGYPVICSLDSLPEQVFIVTAVNHCIDAAERITAEQPPSLDTRTKEKIRTLCHQRVWFTRSALTIKLIAYTGDRDDVAGRQLIASQIVIQRCRSELCRGRILIIAKDLASDDLPPPLSIKPGVSHVIAGVQQSAEDTFGCHSRCSSESRCQAQSAPSRRQSESIRYNHRVISSIVNKKVFLSISRPVSSKIMASSAIILRHGSLSPGATASHNCCVRWWSSSSVIVAGSARALLARGSMTITSRRILPGAIFEGYPTIACPVPPSLGMKSTILMAGFVQETISLYPDKGSGVLGVFQQSIESCEVAQNPQLSN